LVRVAVVGGGLSGLTTAHELIRRTRLDALPLEIRVYEAEERLGGAIRTEMKGGFTLEYGPDSFNTTSSSGLRLAVELGLREELIPAHVERGLLIWWEDRLHRMPAGLSSLSGGSLRALLGSTLLTPRGRIRAGLERFVPPRLTRSDECLAGFLRRRFGRQMCERVGDPLLAGFYRGDPEQLGIDHTFPELVEMERRERSVTRGVRRALRDGGGREPFGGLPKKIAQVPTVSMRAGMGTLVDALAIGIRRNDSGALHVGRRVDRLRPAGDPLGAAAYAVDTQDGETWIADICVLAVPARAAARLVESFAPEVASELTAVPLTSSLTVHLGFPRQALREVPEAIGCLVPHGAGRPTIACAFVHAEFDYRAPPGTALLRVLLGGARKPELMNWSDETAVRVARKEVATLLDVGAEPLFTDVWRSPKAHPQYLVGHAERITAIQRQLDYHSGLLVGGSCLHGVAVPDVIDNARATAGIVADLAHTRLT
jgi:oxygen-dependent protoporphyrinogen oxidase